MTQANFEVVAQSRSDMGKGASRRLRRLQDQVPGIVYGGNEIPIPIQLDHKKLMQSLEHESFYSHILTLSLDNKKQKVVLKDLQRHPFKRSILHVDFQRVKESDVINMKIPLHFIGEEKCPGVKQGGVINKQAIDVEVRCMAAKLPEYLEVDLSTLGLDQAIHLSDLKLPTEVEIPTLAMGKDYDLTIVSVHQTRMAKTEDDDASAGSAKEKS